MMRHTHQVLPPYCMCGAKGWLKCPACVDKEQKRMAANCPQRGGQEESDPRPCTIEDRTPARLPLYAVKRRDMHQEQPQ